MSDVVTEWEVARDALAKHWEQRGDLNQFNDDDGGVCEDGRCMECQYDGCTSDTCGLYRKLAARLGETHDAMVEAARGRNAQEGKPDAS